MDMMSNIQDCTVLNNGVRMPWLGLGVWQVTNPKELDFAVKTALKYGYAAIDTADIYGNEKEVGRAIRESGVPREDVFVTTKLWNARQREGFQAVLKAFETSRKRLDMDYVDLYMIHWPIKGKYVESWKALLKLYEQRVVRAIGVCNFNIHHLQDIIRETGVVPAVNQVELHPWLNQQPLVDYCASQGIQVQAYSPLMNGHLGEVPEVVPIAKKYGRTPAQIVLRWNLQRKIAVIPKSVHEERILENSKIFDFSLSEEDMAAILALNRNQRFLPDPDNVRF
jgi:diketogulonate reductase-like aldo/keto reductase